MTKFITIFHKTRNQVNNSILTDANSYYSRHTTRVLFNAANRSTRWNYEFIDLRSTKTGSETHLYALQVHEGPGWKKKEEIGLSLLSDV